MGITLVAAAALYGIAIAQTQPQALMQAVARIGWQGALLGSLLCLAGIGIRFLRWQMLLRALGSVPPWRMSLRIYLAGVALSWTPGKLGETVRSALLRPLGVPVSDSLAAFLADRLSDVLGVAALGLAAAALLSGAAALFLTVLCAGLLLSFALAAWGRRRALPARMQRLAKPLLRWAAVWTPGRACGCVLAGALAYGLQALVFAGYAKAVLPELAWAACVAGFAAAIFIGAASMLPAGLGAMEATLALTLTQQGADWHDAVAITLLTRLSSLWIPSGIGVLALLGLARRPTQPLRATQA